MPPAEIVAPSRTFALPLPPGEFKAYLFDCDGTVVDSMPLHYLAWRRALDAFSVDFPEELFYEWGGKPVEEILRDLSRAQGIQLPVETASIKEGYFHEALPQLTVVAEVLEHIEYRHGRIPFAIVSGGGRESVERSLAQLGCWTGSKRWSVPRITPAPNPTPSPTFSRRNGSASPRRTASSLRTPSLAWMPRWLPA